MAEGFEPYHVPQQSRRDKLRVGGTSSGMDGAASSSHVPLYDPSLLPSDFISCAAAAAGFHNPNHPIDTEAADQGCKSDPPHPLVKEEGPYQHYLHRIYTNQQSSMAVNPSTVANMNSGDGNNPFLFPSTHFRDFAQSFHSNSSNSALALSLSSHGHDSNPSSRHHSSLSLPLELNLQRYGSTTISTAGGYLIPTVATDVLQVNEAASRSSGLLGPFTGYSSILKGSRFLKPTQQLLEELCDVGHNPPEKMMVDVSMVEGLSNGETSSNSLSNCRDEGEFRRKKCRLISMLEEVCRRYRQYYQQMQDVVESFEYVAGFGNAAPYANLAVKAMSKHFRCLKNAITDQLQLNNKECTRENPNKSKAESPTLRSNDGVQYGQRLSSSGYLEHQPIWRPQRGLPERAVTVLRAWLFDHFLHPYPTDTDKIMLAKQTGLSRSQVSNWFINARVRLWKPMVEEIHMLETQQGQKSLQREERSNNPSTRATPDFPTLVNSLPLETPSTSTQQGHEAPHKRTRNNLPDVSMRNDERHFPYELSNAHHHHQQVHPSFGEGINGVNNSVSLTLGLHQNNNGMSLSEPFQVNDVQRYDIGLEGSNEGYVIGGFEAQHRHFARDLYGGQLLHDFVG